MDFFKKLETRVSQACLVRLLMTHQRVTQFLVSPRLIPTRKLQGNKDCYLRHWPCRVSQTLCLAGVGNTRYSPAVSLLWWAQGQLWMMTWVVGSAAVTTSRRKFPILLLKTYAIHIAPPFSCTCKVPGEVSWSGLLTTSIRHLISCCSWLTCHTKL